MAFLSALVSYAPDKHALLLTQLLTSYDDVGQAGVSEIVLFAGSMALKRSASSWQLCHGLL